MITSCLVWKTDPDGSGLPYKDTSSQFVMDHIYEDVYFKKIVTQKEERKIYLFFCSPDDDSPGLRPFHDGEEANVSLM